MCCVVCLVEMTCTEWSWITWQVMRCSIARWDFIFLHTLKTKYALIADNVHTQHILTVVYSICRNGHGNPVRTTFECAGWRANMRYSACTQHSDFEIHSHEHQHYLHYHTHGQTQQLLEKPYFLWVHLHTVFTQIWSCWYKISTSLNDASSVERYQDERCPWSLKATFLHTCIVPFFFIYCIRSLWGRLKSGTIMCVCEVIVDNVLRCDRNVIKSTRKKEIRCDDSLVDRVYTKI